MAGEFAPEVATQSNISDGGASATAIAEVLNDYSMLGHVQSSDASRDVLPQVELMHTLPGPGETFQPGIILNMDKTIVGEMQLVEQTDGTLVKNVVRFSYDEEGNPDGVRIFEDGQQIVSGDLLWVQKDGTFAYHPGGPAAEGSQYANVENLNGPLMTIGDDGSVVTLQHKNGRSFEAINTVNGTIQGITMTGADGGLAERIEVSPENDIVSIDVERNGDVVVKDLDGVTTYRNDGSTVRHDAMGALEWTQMAR
jgi:hypothetical protein